VARSNQPVGGAVAAALQAELQGSQSGAAVITVKDQTAPGRQGLIGYFAPSMGVLFLFFVASVGARGFLEERASGTLARLRASPITPRSLVGGKIAAMLGMGLVSMLVLWLITVHLFGSTWGAPLPVLLACIASALAMTGIGSLVTVFSTNQQQAIGVAGIIGFVLGLLGGNFFPPGSLPPFLVTMSRVTPNRWALETFGTLALDHGTLHDVWPGLLVLTLMAVITGVVAMTQVRRTVTL
jgi:ABC-2 type transport system permease protein